MKIRVKWLKRLFHRHYIEGDLENGDFFCKKCRRRFSFDELMAISKEIKVDTTKKKAG